MKYHINNAILPMYPLCDIDSHRTAHPLLSGLQTQMHRHRCHFDSLQLKRFHPTCLLFLPPWLASMLPAGDYGSGNSPLMFTTNHHLSLSWIIAVSVQTPCPLELPLLWEGKSGLSPLASSVSADLTFLSFHPSWPLRCSMCFL